MTTSAAQPRSPGLDDAVWHGTAVSILRGIHHDLNGRIGTISGLVQLARMDGALDDETGGLLESEIDRMARLSMLFGEICDDRDRCPEPLRLAEVVHDAEELVRHHRGLEIVDLEIDVRDDIPVVAVRPALLRALVVLLAEAAHRHAQWEVELSKEGSLAELRLEARGEGDATGGERSDRTEAVLAMSVRLVAPFGGRIEASRSEAGAPVFVLRLPAMADDHPT